MSSTQRKCLCERCGGLKRTESCRSNNNSCHSQNNCGSSSSNHCQSQNGCCSSNNCCPGPRGASGPRGLMGLTGASGASGLNGVSGLIGATGVSGVGTIGATGASGVQGATGTIGASGLQGATGVGSTGLTGASGLIGATGLFGVTGISGVSGLIGSTGVSGQSGLIGATGVSGQSGLIGASGIGITGASGLTGAIGATGAVGASGVNFSNNYVFAYDTTEQSIVNTALWQDIIFGNTAYINGWTHNTPTTFECTVSGLYLFVISSAIQAVGGSRKMMIRGTINNVEILGSQLYSDFQSSASTQLVSRNFMQAFAAGDVFRSQFVGSDTSVKLVASSFNPGLPATVTPTSSELIITRIT
jgi:hypothetical protein